MKLLLKLLFGFVALVVLFVALVFGCVYMLEKVVPDVAAQRLKAMTGYRLETGSVELSIMGGSASVKELNLRNPEDWPDEQFVKINEVTFDINPGSMLGDGRREIDKIVMDLGTLSIVTNKESKTNYKDLLEKLRGEKEEKEAEVAEQEPEAEAEEEVESKPFEFLIHRMVVKVDTIRFADYSGSTPKIREHKVDLKLELREVDSVADIIAQTMAQGGSSLITMLSSVQLNFGGEKSDDGDDDGKSIADPVKKSVQGMFDSLKEKIKGE
ncbi:MAG: hypothetical protein JW942_05575 [Opitutales bacterium]|nr:hypothetical protein [Opitutales bacterium]